MPLQQRVQPALTSEAGLALQRYPKYMQGGRAFVLTQLTVLGCRLPLGRGLNSGQGNLSESVPRERLNTEPSAVSTPGDPGNEYLGLPSKRGNLNNI